MLWIVTSGLTITTSPLFSVFFLILPRYCSATIGATLDLIHPAPIPYPQISILHQITDNVATHDDNDGDDEQTHSEVGVRKGTGRSTTNEYNVTSPR